jgi:hypothetical protein
MIGGDQLDERRQPVLLLDQLAVRLQREAGSYNKTPELAKSDTR